MKTNMSVFDKKWSVVQMLKILHSRVYDAVLNIPQWHYQKMTEGDNNCCTTVEDGIIRQGDRWGEECTYIFTQDVAVPEEMYSKNLYLQADICGESTVYLNGSVIGSLDYGHTDVFIKKCVESGEVLRLAIKSTRHFQDFVRGDRLTNKKYPHHVFNQTQLVCKNAVVENLYYLGSLLLEICMNHEDKAFADLVYYALKKNLLDVDYYAGKDVFIQSAKDVREKLIYDLRGIDAPQKAGDILVMGHSHLDLVFLWRWKDTVSKIERTIANTINLAARLPGWIYSQSQTRIIQELETQYPELFQSFDKLVRQGRVELVGNIMAEYDTNIPSAEAMIRQTLYSRQFMRDHGYRESRVCFLPDTFGFSGVLPQILKQCGYEYFCTTKISWNDTNPFPYTMFWWEGIDGTKIKSYWIKGGYGGDFSFNRIKEATKEAEAEELPTTVVQYGLGDGGGGVTEEMLQYQQVMKDLDFLFDIKDSPMEMSLKSVFSQVGQLPTHHGEIYLENHRGTFTSQSKIKQYNRKCEILYRNLEFFSVLLPSRGLQYQEKLIRAGWEVLLFNHFHDTLCGSITNEAVMDTHNSYERIMNSGIHQLKDMLQELGGSCHNSRVWNPTCWYRDEMILFRIDRNKLPAVSLPYQILNEDGDTFEILTNIKNIPPFGYKSIFIEGNALEFESSSSRKRFADIDASFSNTKSTVLESTRYTVRFTVNGDISSIYDKMNQRDVLRGKGNYLEAFVDYSGFFDSWNIQADFETKKFLIQEVAVIQKVENGPLRWTMQVKRKFRHSIIDQYISIYDDCARIDIYTEVEFKEPHFLLKAGFDINVKADEAHYDVSMGTVVRSTRNDTTFENAQFEVPVHKWCDISESSYGVALLNDCKYGCDIKGNRMRITLLKTATYPDPLQDVGQHSFTYSLYPHSAGFAEGEVVREAHLLNNPCYLSEGDCKTESFSWLSCCGGSAVVETVKKAETGEGIILRCYEAHGVTSTTSMAFEDKLVKAFECTMLEEVTGELECYQNSISVTLKPYEIKTILVLIEVNKMKSGE